MIQTKKRNNLYRFLAISLFASNFIPLGNCLASDSEAISSQTNQKIVSMSGDIKGAMTYSESDYGTDFTTRLRLQLQSNFIKNFEVTGRINATKKYAPETYDDDEFPSTDDDDFLPSDDDDFLVDRLYFSWSDIGNKPFTLLGGRLPTMGENSPSHLRLGLDQPSGTFSSFTDIALDGVVLGYSYQKPFPGKIEFYYATQFDVGYESNENVSGLVDSEIYGFKWDFLKKGTHSIVLQSFLVSDIWNLLGNEIFSDPLSDPFFHYSAWKNYHDTVGGIYETSFTYFDTFQNLAFFVNLGWSYTNPEAMNEFGEGLLSVWREEPTNEDGYCLYAGLRYTLDDLSSKVGLEFNQGSKYWINFTQNTETAKLATRGSVVEAYWTFAPPIPSALSKWAQSIVGRIGYQYYDYKYTGSGLWLREPLNIDVFKNDPLAAQFYIPIDSEYKIYAAVEMYF